MKKSLTAAFLLVFSLIVFLPGQSDWQEQQAKMEKIIRLISTHHPENNFSRNITYRALSGLMQQLDPHSYFLDPANYRSMFEDHKGNYFGIGTKIRKIENRLTVISPIKGTPAHRLGIIPGDVIVKINGKSTSRLTDDQAMKLLRGEKNTVVEIEIRRRHAKANLVFKIRRAEIPLSTLSYSLIQPGDAGIAYIGIRTFGRSTSAELKSSLDDLIKKHRVRGLVLDLRWNSGGSLLAAVEIADMFLEKGKMIVSVRGRTMNEGFTSQEPDQYRFMEIAVLINRSSASASEIVAAALKEHNRAVIIGSRSWGKGMVETVFNLPLKCGLALTTAKYYTPSGKCLQRDFSDLENYYTFNAYENYDTSTAVTGGVIPHKLVKDKPLPAPVARLVSKGAFFDFVRSVIDRGFKVEKDFRMNASLFRDFKDFLKKNKIPLDKNETTRYKDDIYHQIERKLLSQAFSDEAGFDIYLTHNPVNREAVRILKQKLQEQE